MHQRNITAGIMSTPRFSVSRLPDLFDSVSGIHKANFYQAAVLWHSGGASLDIKTIGILPLDVLIAEHHDRPTFYACFSRLRGANTLHIGALAATPHHPLVREWIEELYEAGKNGLLSHYRPDLIVCHSLYAIFVKHFGLPGRHSRAANAGTYESASGGRLILWEQRYFLPVGLCKWKHTGYRPMLDRYGGCSLIYNLSSSSAEPIMGVRDPTYPLSWANREVNLSLGLPLNFNPSAKANLSYFGRKTPGDGFFTMDKNEVNGTLVPLKGSLAEKKKIWKG